MPTQPVISNNSPLVGLLFVTTDLGRAESITLDTTQGKMYWTDSGTDKIQRANLNGTNIEELVTTGLEIPAGIVLAIVIFILSLQAISLLRVRC